MDNEEQESEHIPINNDIEMSLNPETDTSVDPQYLFFMQMADIMQQKVKVVEKYLSDEGMKTEITNEQRRLLPLLENHAICPYPSVIKWNQSRLQKLHELKPDIYTREFCEQELIKIQTELAKPVLQDFVNQFLRYGIAVKRKGRKEDQNAITAMMSESIELLNRSNQGDKKKWL